MLGLKLLEVFLTAPAPEAARTADHAVAWRQLLSELETHSAEHRVAQAAEDVVPHVALKPCTLSIYGGACDELLDVSVGLWLDLLNTLDEGIHEGCCSFAGLFVAGIVLFLVLLAAVPASRMAGNALLAGGATL